MYVDPLCRMRHKMTLRRKSSLRSISPLVKQCVGAWITAECGTCLAFWAQE